MKGVGNRPAGPEGGGGGGILRGTTEGGGFASAVAGVGSGGLGCAGGGA